MSKVIIWIHCVWACKHRYPYLETPKKEVLLQHLRKNAKEKNIYIDSLNAHVDHIHCLIRLNARQSIAEVAQLLKGESSRWSNENKLFEKRLFWARGYYAASIDNNCLHSVRRYIIAQETRHGLQKDIATYLSSIQKQELSENE